MWADFFVSVILDFLYYFDPISEIFIKKVSEQIENSQPEVVFKKQQKLIQVSNVIKLLRRFYE